MTVGIWKVIGSNVKSYSSENLISRREIFQQLMEVQAAHPSELGIQIRLTFQKTQHVNGCKQSNFRGFLNNLK